MGTDIFLHDTFTGDPGDSLGTHQPEIGQSWQQHSYPSGGAAFTLKGTSGDTYVWDSPSGTGGSILDIINLQYPAGRECDVEAVFQYTGNSAAPWDSTVEIRLFARTQQKRDSSGPLSVLRGYHCRYNWHLNSGSGLIDEKWQLVKGYNTQLEYTESSRTRPANGVTETHTLTFQCRDFAKKVLFDGAEKISFDDNTYLSRGQVGLSILSAGGPSTGFPWGSPWKVTDFKGRNYGDPSSNGGLVLASFI